MERDYDDCVRAVEYRGHEAVTTRGIRTLRSNGQGQCITNLGLEVAEFGLCLEGCEGCALFIASDGAV